ncbi:hypothetical protein AAC03nite_20520 [Alicyclobacillus acidoterrestris]|nr:hypothetical protein AAC03nite_20520 [Alicyclobacillus acidoterrestris]
MSLTQAEVLVRTKDLSHEEWLENRRKGIGGSDIGAICGVNPWKSPMSVYLDKIGELPPVEENDAMHFGTLLEPIVAKEYALRTGYRVQQSNKMYQHPDYPWALANVDRIILNRKRGHGILEIKTASEYQAKEWADGNVPEQYQLQLQWYLWITGFKWGAFAALVGGNKFYSFEMERNDQIIEYMVDIAERFWHGVQNRIPPEFDGSNDSSNVLKILYPSSLPTEIDLTVPAADLVEQYETAVGEMKYWEAKKKAAENKLKALMGENERARIGDRVVSWKAQERRTVDAERLAEDHPEIYERYLKTSTYRTFRVK